MRVLILTRIFPSSQEPLSAPFNRQQFAALARRADVEILATLPYFPGASLLRRWSPAGRLGSVPREETIDGLRVTHPRVLYLPKVGHSVAAALYAASVLPDVLSRRGRFDVLLGSWAYPDGAAVVALGELLSLPAVVKLHGSDMNVIAKMPGPRANLRWALRRAARVVAVSKPLAEEAITLGARADRVDVVANGVDSSVFFPRDRDAARRELGVAEAARLIVYVGRVERAKGSVDLVEAFLRVAAEDTEVTLALVGHGGALDECRRLAAPLGDRVRFVGAVPLAQVPLWMAASSVVTLPSWNEGTPNVLLEALACGRRVVATRVGGIPDVVPHAELGELVEARCIPELAAALARVVGSTYDPSAVAQLGSRGGWDESAARLLASLELACER